MSKFLQQREMWSRFKKDTQGNFALIWAFGLTATMTAVGAGIDYSTASRVTTTSQAAADQIALHSAIFYSTHERMPETNEEGFIDGQIYRGDDAGYNFPPSVRGGNRGVKFRVDYDEDNGEVAVNIYGRVNTNFMSMFNSSFKTIKFSSQATAKFKEVELKNPASITLVLDNSGSMAWDDKPSECEWEYDYGDRRWEQDCDTPSNAEPRIDGLKTSVTNFMDLLDSYVGPQAVTSKRVLRTGMIPYDDSIITNREVEMEWGTLNSGDITSMEPSGSTNSSPPIARAWDWLQEENAVHAAESGEDNPLRYMIFMTDGQNSADPEWFQTDGTNYWRGITCTSNRRRNYCYYVYEQSTTQPNTNDTWDWEEGEWISPSDRDSKNSCEAMKAQGVRVFTIGFALEPGSYMTNYPSSWNNDVANIEQETTDAAYSMLAACASSPDDFVAAENVETLEEAFATIGSTIVEDVVRLSQ